MRSGYYIGDIAPAPPTVVIPAGYTLVPTPVPAPITAATGGLNLDWRGEPMQNPLVPIVELHHSGEVGQPAFVPLSELDSLVGELSDDYDFGLGKLSLQNPEELGAIKASFKLPTFTLPKIAIDIGQGQYKRLLPASKPTRKAPVRAAVKAVRKPLVIARKKKPSPTKAINYKTIDQIYAELKRQGKIVNLLATRKKVTAESKRKAGQEGFREDVMSLLRKIEKQCAGDAQGNYFARWNKLKKITGVGVHDR
jgi:hypothetical protein